MPRFVPILFALASFAAAPADDAAKVRSGQILCRHCQLQNADLTNACAKGADFAGADFADAHAVLMCMSHADLEGAHFRGTDLSGANLSFAKLDGADFTGAILTATSFYGTDLRRTRGLTQSQLDAACGNAATKPPSGLRVPRC